MIHFDFDERYQDELVVGTAITRREGVIFSIVAHALGVAAILMLPTLALFQPSAEELEAQRVEQQRQIAEAQQNRTFVFVQPRIERPAPPPQRAELSDIDRQAQAREAAPRSTNPLPFSRGNSAERTEPQPDERLRGEPTPQPPQPEPPQPEQQPEQQIARNLPQAPTGLQRSTESATLRPRGALGDALRNLERYVQNETFNNPQGGNQNPGSEIQFDTKGVEFGPWIRRFVAQVRRNWLIPQAAMALRGRVVLQFNIHKSGQITDLQIVQPSGIDSFNRAAYNAILGSNPVEPLPPEYPDEKALFTVTFYYNEQPGP